MQILDVAVPSWIWGISSPYCLARLVNFCICSGGICGTRANNIDVVVTSHNPGRIWFSAALAAEAAEAIVRYDNRRIFRIESLGTINVSSDMNLVGKFRALPFKLKVQ